MFECDYGVGPIDVKGAAFDDFRLTQHLPPQRAPALIERDRLIMAARPGFNRKLLPLRIEPDRGTAYSGGRYLFDTYENAVAFSRWVADEFAIDGVLILDRPDFAEVTTSVWRVVGAYDFKDIHTSQHAYRTEIWKLRGPSAIERFVNAWPALRDRAQDEDCSSLWALCNEATSTASLVTVVERAGAGRGTELDFVTIAALEQRQSYGTDWERQGWASKTFDRSHWVFTVWFPNTGAADSKPPLWPNSPPLPEPETDLRAAPIAARRRRDADGVARA